MSGAPTRRFQSKQPSINIARPTSLSRESPHGGAPEPSERRLRVNSHHASALDGERQSCAWPAAQRDEGNASESCKLATAHNVLPCVARNCRRGGTNIRQCG